MYIPKFAKEFKGNKSVQTVKSETTNLLQELKQIKKSRQDQLKQVDQSEKSNLETVQNLRKKLIKRIDELAAAESEKIKQKHQAEKDRILADIQNIEENSKVTEVSSKRLSEFKGDNESQLFVYTKKGEKISKQGKEFVQQLKKTTNKKSSRFIINPDIEGYMCRLGSLGRFTSDDTVISAQLLDEYNIKVSTDKEVCHVNRSYLLADGTVLLTDYINKCLKQINLSNRECKQYEMPGNPCDICGIGSEEVAVTLMNEKKVQFVSVGASIHTTRSFSVDQYCGGICYSDGELFVSCGNFNQENSGYVGVYNLSGAPLRTIQTDPAGQHIFYLPGHITTGTDGKLYIADEVKGVIVMDRNGNVISTFTDPDLICACGICTLDNGDLLVCGGNSHNVLQFSSNGKKRSTLLSKKDDIYGPLSVMVDHTNNTMIITSNESDTIKVYSLK